MSDSPSKRVGLKWRAWVTDSRGRRVEQLDPVALYLLHRSDVIEDETLERLAERLAPGAIKRRRWFTFAMPLSLIVFAAILAVGYLGSPSSSQSHLISALTNPLMWILLIVGAISTWFEERRRRVRHIRRVMLEVLCCPHCGYSLGSVPVSPEDGATVCPECGCAWKLDLE